MFYNLVPILLGIRYLNILLCRHKTIFLRVTTISENNFLCFKLCPFLQNVELKIKFSFTVSYSFLFNAQKINYHRNTYLYCYGNDYEYYRYSSYFLKRFSCTVSSTDSIEDLGLDYEDDRNSMIAVAEKENFEVYDEFYDELDNRIRVEQSMNMIFFGPPSSFLRLDPDSILHILTQTKKQMIPISRALLAWDILTDGKTAAFLQGREFLAFGSLLNVIPEEDLYYVNFGDPSVLKYFANHYVKLQPRKFGILAAAYMRYFGETWYENSTFINELGFLLCGFPSNDLEKISPITFMEINLETLSKAGKCNTNQTRTLYSIAVHRDAYGEPYKWSSHEIGRLSALFTCIPEGDISSIQLEAVTAISSEVMTAMNQEKLEYFTKQQILRMNPKTRRIYILRMQLRSSYDMNEIARQNCAATNKPFILQFILNIVVLTDLFVL